MPRSAKVIFAALIVGLLVGGPWAYAYHRSRNYRNFRVVRTGVLYRSGQLSLTGLQRVVHDHGIRTVITLRDVRTAEEDWCRSQEINYHRIPMRAWEGPEGVVPAEESVREFRRIMDDPANYPVLIHCFAGSHRTGAYCAVYRMEYEGWTNRQAIEEMRACGYENIDNEWDVLGYLEQYRPRSVIQGDGQAVYLGGTPRRPFE